MPYDKRWWNYRLCFLPCVCVLIDLLALCLCKLSLLRRPMVHLDHGPFGPLFMLHVSIYRRTRICTWIFPNLVHFHAPTICLTGRHWGSWPTHLPVCHPYVSPPVLCVPCRAVRCLMRGCLNVSSFRRVRCGCLFPRHAWDLGSPPSDCRLHRPESRSTAPPHTNPAFSPCTSSGTG